MTEHAGRLRRREAAGRQGDRPRGLPLDPLPLRESSVALIIDGAFRILGQGGLEIRSARARGILRRNGATRPASRCSLPS